MRHIPHTPPQKCWTRGHERTRLSGEASEASSKRAASEAKSKPVSEASSAGKARSRASEASCAGARQQRSEPVRQRAKRATGEASGR